MTIIIIIIILLLVYFLLSRNCGASFRTRSGRMFRARDQKTAEMLDFLQEISVDLSYDINPKQGELLRKKLQNTSFIELLFVDPRILGWNYDKGREIGIKMYKVSGEMMPPEEIIHTLFHELAHSMTEELQHPPGGEWERIDRYFQTFAPKYVKIFKFKIYELSKQYE